MKFLGVDTTKSCSYVILNYKDKLEVVQLKQTRKVSEMLLESIDDLLEKHDVKLADLDYFACVTGPGSFTGLRIGMSTIKAFQQALQKKIIALNSFEVLAERVQQGCVILSCTKNSFYYAMIKDAKVEDMGVENLDKLKTDDRFKSVTITTPEDDLQEHAHNFVKDYPDVLVDAIIQKIKNNQTTLPENFVPLYLQQSQAERNWKNNDN